MPFLLQPIFEVYMDMGEEGLGQVLPQPVKKKKMSESASWLIKMQVAVKTPMHLFHCRSETSEWPTESVWAGYHVHKV